MSRIVVSLGETAFVDDKMEPNQRVRAVAQALEPLISSGHQLVVCHGDAKLVGMINLVSELGARGNETSAMPFAECTAMSEGFMGFHLATELDNLLMKKDPQRAPTVAVLTQSVVEVDSAKKKSIGSFFDKAAAQKLMQETGDEYAQVSEKEWRRQIATARPVGFREESALKDLLKTHPVIICAGGGGVPVLREGKSYRPAAAIVEIDEAAEVMAEKLDADCLLLLSEEAPDKTGEMTAQQLRALAKDEPGQSVRLEAAARFADSGPGRYAVIADFSHVKDAADGRAGLRVS